MKNDNLEILGIFWKVNPSIKCPHCKETFPAKKAGLFDIRDKRLPKQIQSRINGEFQSIRLEDIKIGRKAVQLDKKRAALKEKTAALKKKIKARPKRVKIVTTSVNIGQIMEKILPATSKFRYNAKDCRALFDPVDYVSFNGLEAQKKVESISFLEVKTGNARLQKNQKLVKKAVEEGKIKLKRY